MNGYEGIWIYNCEASENIRTLWRSTYPMKQAIKLSLIKWKYCKDTGCADFELYNWLEEKHPNISQLQSKCGLCDKYLSDNASCEACPLYELWKIDCYDKKSLFQKWYREEDFEERKILATKIYNDIKSLQLK